MKDVLGALADQQQEFTDLLTGLDDDQWDFPSACEGWSVADVVLHMIQTNDLAILSALDRFEDVGATPFFTAGAAANVDELAELAVQNERGVAPKELLQRWRDGALGLCEALDERGPSHRLQWVAGDLSARTLATTRIAETWIHAGDVAAGLGVDLDPTERLWHVARLAWRTVPYAFTRDGRELSGPVGFDLVGPTGEPWQFGLDPAPTTTISGPAHDLCRVAARRAAASDTALSGDGPDAAAVLDLVRTFA